MEQYRELGLYLEELNMLLENLFQSGFASEPDSVLVQLQKTAEESKDYGLFYAAKALQSLYDKLSAGRHNFQTDFSEIAGEYCKLVRYRSIFKKRLELLQAKSEMLKESRDRENNGG